jgi:hypothetical protein
MLASAWAAERVVFKGISGADAGLTAYRFLPYNPKLSVVYNDGPTQTSKAAVRI